MSMTQEFRAYLTTLFGQIFGTDVALDTVHRLSGGASQEIWALQGSRHRAILRRAPGGIAGEGSSAAIGLTAEAQLITAARAASVPAPEVLHILSPEDGLGAGFLMEHVNGETIARPILRDEAFHTARQSLPTQCGRALADIHSLDLSALPGLPVSSGLDQLERYEQIFRDFAVNRPVLELAFAWLRDTAPPPLDPVLVHGDFRLGNLMIDQAGLVAVLDWELANIGDPREDIGWICVNSWRFGQSQNRVGGFGAIEPLLAAYNDKSGLALTASDIGWWEALGTLKWGVMCMLMYDTFRSGKDPSVERAAIGRRVSETEIDLIHLMERAHA